MEHGGSMAEEASGRPSRTSKLFTQPKHRTLKTPYGNVPFAKQRNLGLKTKCCAILKGGVHATSPRRHGGSLYGRKVSIRSRFPVRDFLSVTCMRLTRTRRALLSCLCLLHSPPPPPPGHSFRLGSEAARGPSSAYHTFHTKM